MYCATGVESQGHIDPLRIWHNGFVTLVADRSERLDVFLARTWPHLSRSKISDWMRSHSVNVEGKVAKPSAKLVPGDTIEFAHPPVETPAHDLSPADIPLDVLFEDDMLLVVNKPRGLPTHPAPSWKGPTLVNALLARSHRLSAVGEVWRPGIVHRLDKDTTGVILVAKTDVAHRKLAAQIASKTASRTYLALITGRPARDSFVIDASIGRDPARKTRMAVVESGRSAQTEVTVLRRLGELSLVQCTLRTGRTHQIRVHLAALGHPVLGDSLYGSTFGGPIQLHAWEIGFDHPASGARVVLRADLPEDWRAGAGLS